MKTVLVTGASGFVGQHFIEINKEKYNIETISLKNGEWRTKSFGHIDTVLHLAGKAHQMTKIEDSIYFKVNTSLTKELFEKIRKDGVQHFIYISSTKVYGDGDFRGLHEHSITKPTDAYGKSKLEAEEFLLQQDFPIAVVRPPLIYGKGVKGNMEKLINLCKRKSVLPLGRIYNKRSMVFIGNLVALLNEIIDQKATGIFIAGNRNPVGTSYLINAIAKALNKKIILISIPSFIRFFIKKLKPALYVRLFGSFYVSNDLTNRNLKFTPPYSFDESIQKTIL